MWVTACSPSLQKTCLSQDTSNFFRVEIEVCEFTILVFGTGVRAAKH